MKNEIQLLDEISLKVDGYKSDMKVVRAQLEETNEELNRIKEGGFHDGGRPVNFAKSIASALKEAGVNSQLAKGQHLQVTINKVAGTFTTGNVDGVGTNSIPFSLSDAEQGLTRVQRRRAFLSEISNTRSTTKMYVQWAEQENPDGDAGSTAEGSTKNQVDFDWVEKSKQVTKITAFIKVSKESLDDLDGLAADINSELRELVSLESDDSLMTELTSAADAYSAGSFAGTISGANIFDVLRTGIAQITAASFSPSHILMHPTDVASMDLSKAEDGHYVLPSFIDAKGRIVSGVQIVENPGVTQDKFIVGDFSKFNVRIREGLLIDVGYDGNDFTKNLVTVLAEMRLAGYIKGVHESAFVYGDFSDAITALESGS